MAEFNERYYDYFMQIGKPEGLTREDVIHPFNEAIGTEGSIAILKGNLAPEGAVIKHTACPKEMFHAVLRAKPFDSEEACLDAVLHCRFRISQCAISANLGVRIPVVMMCSFR